MAGAARNRSAVELFGIPTPPRTARERLLVTAIDLFYVHGFHAVGLDRVIAETGVTKTTFYKHFASKDDLVVAAIERRDAWERAAWGRAIRKLAGDDPRGQLLALFDVLDVWFNDPSFGGCIFINAAAEFADPREPAHQVAAAYKRECRDGWCELFRRIGAPDPAALGDQYTALVEGTLIMRHVHGRDDAARVIRPVIERMLEGVAPGAGL